MYHALLTNRYLTSRVIPLIAVAAVALCVALVIIVVSVMTGFLDMVRSSGRTLMGDVIVSAPVNGIPYYERLIARIRKLPQAAAATPVVDSWGLLRMPYPEGSNKETETVQVWGIEPDGFTRVTGYDDTLYWKTVSDKEWERRLKFVVDGFWRDLQENDTSLAEVFTARPGDGARRKLLDLVPADDRPESLPADTAELRAQIRDLIGDHLWAVLASHEPRLRNLDHPYADALAMRDSRTGRPAAVLGMHVSQANKRQSDGSILPMGGGYWWMPNFEVTLTVLPTPASGGLLEPESWVFPVVNEFVSGVFLIDEKRVMVPLRVAQRLLHLDESEVVDPDVVDEATGLPVVLGKAPPRATMILIRAADGVTPDELTASVERAYDQFRAEVLLDDDALVKPPRLPLEVSIKTWAQQQAQFIDPIEKERELMRTLFSLVYLVCAGLVLSIFWAIVYEKTRDIGILRSIGASRLGISWIFLRYGLVVGVAGAIAGLGLAYLIVHNINAIHAALGDPPISLAWVIGAAAVAAIAATVVRGRGGRLLPIVLGSMVAISLAVATGLIVLIDRAHGIVIWDPAVYYFTHIPNDVDMVSAAITMAGAVVFSLIGAFLPAAKAADTDPVQALRYE